MQIKVHKKGQKVQIKSANKATLWDALGVYFYTLQLSFAVPLNNEDIFDVLLRETGILGVFRLLRAEKVCSITCNNRSICHYGSAVGISINPIKEINFQDI